MEFFVFGNGWSKRVIEYRSERFRRECGRATGGLMSRARRYLMSRANEPMSAAVIAAPEADILLPP